MWGIYQVPWTDHNVGMIDYALCDMVYIYIEMQSVSQWIAAVEIGLMFVWTLVTGYFCSTIHIKTKIVPYVGCTAVSLWHMYIFNRTDLPPPPPPIVYKGLIVLDISYALYTF